MYLSFILGLCCQITCSLSGKLGLDLRTYSAYRSDLNVREINAELRNNRGVTHHLLSLCGARINQEEAQRLVENVVNLDRQHAVAAEYVTERLNTRKRRISVSIILSYCSQYSSSPCSTKHLMILNITKF